MLLFVVLFLLQTVSCVPLFSSLVPGTGSEKQPPIYVINLARSAGRWEKMAAQLRQHGLSGRRVEAVDGRSLSNNDLRRVSTPLATHLLPRGVIGCFLSHVLFWELVVERGHECAIVLEDDCELQPDFASAVAETVRELPTNWDICLLGALGCAHPQGKHGILNELCAIYMGGTRRCQQISERVFVPRKPAGTHAYLISRRGAAKLLSLLTKATYHIDFVAWHSGLGLNLYAANPFVAYQDISAASTLVMAQVELESKSKPQRWGRRAASNASAPTQHAQSSSLLSRLAAKTEVGGGTRQTWAHVFAEPLLQLPHGPLITIGRHQVTVSLALLASAALLMQPSGSVWHRAGRTLLGTTVSAVVLVWLTVRYLVHQAIAAAVSDSRARARRPVAKTFSAAERAQAAVHAV